MKITRYVPPNGRRLEENIAHIRLEDEKYFDEVDARLSTEVLRTGEPVLYALTPEMDPDDEIIYVVPAGQSCIGAFQMLREMLEKHLNAGL